jgi:hypothetical protein
MEVLSKFSFEVFVLKVQVEPSIKERSLRAFMDLAIVSALAEKAYDGV